MIQNHLLSFSSISSTLEPGQQTNQLAKHCDYKDSLQEMLSDRMRQMKNKQDTKHKKNSQQHDIVSSIAEEKVTQESSQDKSYAMFTAKGSSSNPLIIHVKLNNVLVLMEFDTGASL